MKKKYRSTSHVVYDIKYHFVWIPKYRYKVLEGKMKEFLKEVIGQICEGMCIQVVEGEICGDHVHMCASVPPKYSASEVMKKIKGITSERIFREFPEIKKKYWGQHFWARGYFVSTVGIDEETIREYIKKQSEDRIENQMNLWN
ncbi:MAG: IS200/IS605 family transposase [Chlamydiota bacterium]|nr:IS200/IS605 family transposase [Chlamydiota bacterium]